KYLLTGTGHVLFSVDLAWLIVLQGGVEKNYGMDFAVNGQGLGGAFRSRLAFVGDIGAQHALDDYWSLAFSLRFTILSYDVEDISVGANSVGLTFSMHYAR